MADEYDNLIRESTFREMLSERLTKFLKSFDKDVSDKEADMYRSVLSIVCGVLADIPKIKG
jgi:hypothetical protein